MACTYQSELAWSDEGYSVDDRLSSGPRARPTSGAPARKGEPVSAANESESDGGGQPEPSTPPADNEEPDPVPGGDENETPPASNDQHDDPALNGIVTAHNVARARVVPTPASPLQALTWSSSAAAVASAWASGCTFGHNPNRGNLGENVYAASAGYGSTAASVVESWESESSDYDYATNSCSGVCGHYTQVVWASTTAVGCAMQVCSQNSPFGGGSWQLWVCNYAPPGNYVGQRPY